MTPLSTTKLARTNTLALLLALCLAPAACQSAEPVDSRLTLARSLTRAEDWARAASLWTEIYRASSGENREAGLASAEALENSGHAAVASTRLAELARRFPEDVAVLERLGEALEEAGDLDGAAAAYAGALRADPSSPGAMARLAALGSDAAEDSNALSSIRASGDLDSVDADSLLELGVRAAAVSDFEGAIEALDAAVRSGSLSAADVLRAARAVQPDSRTAPWLRSLVELDPMNTEALTLLGRVQLAAGLTEQAVETLGRAASTDPGDTFALRAFAEALNAAGQSGRARKILEQIEGDAPAPPGGR